MTSAVREPTRSPFLAFALALLAATALWFILQRTHYFTDFSVDSFGARYWSGRWALVAHIAGGIVASLTGLVQLWLGLTGRIGALHRRLGRIYVGAIAIGASGAIAMFLTISQSLGNLGFTSGLVALTLAWIVTTAIALAAIRRGQVALHRAWMMRSYAVTFGFVAFRLINEALAALLAPVDPAVGSQFDTIAAWGCWAIPLLLVEVGLGVEALRKVGR